MESGMSQKIVLGLSGGVDSAVSARLLLAQGYAVHGLFMDTGMGGAGEAQRTADALGIPLYIAPVAVRFSQEICGYFQDAYQHARTPNPCVVCNRRLKFDLLCRYADEIGAPWIATGHYARIARGTDGQVQLLRACSPKDQSYMLAWLPPEVLERCVFPLGELPDKQAVRALARESGLEVHDKKDSMDLCFIPDGDWTGWLERAGAALPPGNFIDETGRVLGQHQGLHRYTVGQRKGLGVPASGRLFVHALRPETNEVVLSLRDVYARAITVSDVNLCAPEYAAHGSFACDVRVRYSKSSTRGTVTVDGARARVVFEQPVRAPAIGQFAVWYDGERVIGGGFIEETENQE